MTLTPKLPPGRANRKALQFTDDIRRLRDAGYTHSAIRLALLDAGVSVSLSTIKRESARRQACTAHTSRVVIANRSVSSGAAAAACPDPSPEYPRMLQGARSHDVAEAFFAAHPSNPLVRTQEIP